MSNSNGWLLSPRLALRRFSAGDLDLLDRLNSDEQAMRYLGGPVSRETTKSMLDERILGYYDQHPGFGVWVTLHRATGECIGFHLLNHIRGEACIQIGYRLFPAWWGQGYATEMCLALLRYGYGEMKLPQIVAITDPANMASQRVLLKSGLHRKGERTLAHPSYAPFGPQAWFERDAADWLAEFPR